MWTRAIFGSYIIIKGKIKHIHGITRLKEKEAKRRRRRSERGNRQRNGWLDFYAYKNSLFHKMEKYAQLFFVSISVFYLSIYFCLYIYTCVLVYMHRQAGIHTSYMFVYAYKVDICCCMLFAYIYIYNIKERYSIEIMSLIRLHVYIDENVYIYPQRNHCLSYSLHQYLLCAMHYIFFCFCCRCVCVWLYALP